jgi:3-oxoacyl-[acyl-carrier-protein] synthase III
LGEIEAALNQHRSVQQSAVMARQTGPHLDDKRLVAYFIPAVDTKPTVGDLREHLKETLPDYMIPSSFVSMDSFPLNAAGKVDRRALPAPDTSRPDLNAKFVAPRNESESVLANIWARVLSLDNVGVQDNFFDLGGASLQSLEVSALANEHGFEIEPAMVFQYPTVAELAEAVPRRSVEVVAASGNGNGRTPEIASPGTKPAATSLSGNGHARRHATTIIESLGMYLPENVVDSDEIVRGCRNPLDFPLEAMTGIKRRRVADPDEYSIDLARKAIAQCLRRSRNQPEHIDLLICCNISRYDGSDHGITFEPSTAARLKHEFGLKSALALDVSNACAGFFTAIKIVDALISCEAATRAMVVSGEYITHLTRTAQLEIENYLDHRLAGLTLGDSGLAAILERSPSPTKGFQDLEMYTLGQYSSLCIAKATDQSHGGAVLINDAVKGTAVALSQAVSHAQQMLSRNGWSNGEMDHLIMHQTSQTTLDGAVEKLNAVFNDTVCHSGNTVYNVAERGNTATTTHLVALIDKILAGEIQSDSNVVFAISGSGQTVGTALYALDDLPDRVRSDLPAVKRNGACMNTPSAGPSGVRIESIGTISTDAEIDRDTRSLLKAAGQACLDQSAYDRCDIELVLHAGVYRTDYVCEPALATIAAGDFGMNSTLESPPEKRTFAFDVMNGSVGFLNACYLATKMMQADQQQAAMVITSEVDNNAGQADATGIEQTGSALILERADDPHAGFGGFLFRSFGEHVDRYTSKTEWADGKPRLDFHRDRQLDDLYLRYIPDVVTELLDNEDLGISDIHHILPPQISASFIAALASTLGVEQSRMIDATQGMNDLMTNAIPYALDALLKRSEAKPGHRCLIISAGSGIEVGCAIYRL